MAKNNTNKNHNKAIEVGIAATVLGLGAAAVKVLSNEKTRGKVISVFSDIKDQISAESKSVKKVDVKRSAKAKKVSTNKKTTSKTKTSKSASK